MVADDIHAMSETLAADPSSLVFLPLAEALLARGDLVHAAQVAQRGATRHADRIEAHDLVARIALAQGDETRAEVAWEAVLRLDASFGTAHRGLGLVRYRQGRLDEALLHLTAAAAEDAEDGAVRSALDAVRGVIAARDSAVRSSGALTAPAPVVDAAPAADSGDDAVDPAGASPAGLFDAVLEDSKQVALLLDVDGLIAAGQYRTADGTDLGSEIGAHLSGVGDEAERAMRHFGLGRWTRLVIETEAATIAMVPLGERSVLVAAPRDVPLGFVRRTLERCVAVSRHWLGEGA